MSELGQGFEWHTHTFEPAAPVSTGSVLHGLDEMVKELQRRKANWTEVRFDGLIEHFAPKKDTYWKSAAV